MKKESPLTLWQKLAGCIIATAAVVTLCWKVCAMPVIQKQIDRTTNPIIEVLEFQTWLMMQTMTDEQIQKAEAGYTAAKKARIKRD
jgi:hypothetical protein